MKLVQQVSWFALICMTINWVSAGQAHGSISMNTATVTGFANATGGSSPNPFQIIFSDLPTESLTGGLLTLETFGDFNGSKEWIDISIDSNDYGRLWDNRGSNDDFRGLTFNDDNGQQYGQFGTNAGATLELSKSELDAFLTDGVFVLGFDKFGFKVDDIHSQPEEYITATLEFEYDGVGITGHGHGSVPEPTTFMVWSLLGTIGAFGWRRKDRE